MPFETTLFFDSKKGTGTSDNFTVDFEPPIVLDIDKQYSIGLVACDLWNSWFNVSTSNNQFRYYNGTEWKEIVVPAGAYSIEDINSEISRVMEEIGDYDSNNKKSNIIITANYNTGKTRIEILNSYEIDFEIENSLRTILGFESKKLTRNGIHDSENNGVITTVQSLLLHCSVATGSYLNGSMSDIIYAFSVDQPPSSLLSIKPFRIFHIPIQRCHQISRIGMRITDQDNNSIDLNGERVTYYLHVKESSS